MKFRLTKFTVAILALCLLTRVGLFLVARPWEPTNERAVVLQFDAVGYHALAVNLLQHGVFSQTVDGQPEGLRTPGYPLFLALCYSAFGQRTWVVLIAQLFLDTLSCFLLLVTFTRTLGSKAASYAGLFYALDPHLVLYANHLLSETVFVFCCVVCLFFMAQVMLERRRYRRLSMAAVAGLCLGVATLVRPVSQFLPGVLVLFLALTSDKLVEGLKVGGVLALTFILVLSPWLLRNYRTFDVLSLSSSGGYNLLFLHVASFETDRRGVQDKRIAQDALRSEANEMMRADGIDPDAMHPYGMVPARYYRQLARQYMRRYPGRFAKHYAVGILHLFLELDTPNYARYLHVPVTDFYTKGQSNILKLMVEWFRQKTTPELAIGVSIMAYLVLCYTAVLWGGVVSVTGRSDHQTFLLLCALVSAYFVFIVGTAGFARFRVPAIPFYLSFAGVGSTSIERWVRRGLK
jgi:4-amino-4-deoxy-L-arabinose transferase-like glycosyltransferase